MATTPPFDFSLPDYFVDFRSLDDQHSLTEFEFKIDGEVVRGEAMRLHSSALKDYFSLCFRYTNEPYLRVATDLHIPQRPKRPTQYSSDWFKSRPLDPEGLVLRGMWRFLFLVDADCIGGKGRYWLCLDRDMRSGVWVGYDNPSLWGDFDVEPHFSHFVAALSDSDSDIRFVLWWMELSREEKIDLSTFYTNGDEKELRQVVQAIAVYEAPQHEHDQLIYSNGFLETDWMFKYVKIGRPAPKFHIPYPAPHIRLEMWGKHVRNYFWIDGDVELMRRHQWLRPIQPNVTLECAQATHHERMEAALFLRE